MLRVYDEFAGVGGTSHGASYVPGEQLERHVSPRELVAA
jgi:hypothetical protein